MKQQLNQLLNGFVYRDKNQLELDKINSPFWSSRYFLLDKVKIFKKLSGMQQQNLIHQCNQMLLAESLAIEEYGIEYAAKLALLAESQDEKMIYGLMGADEATHLYWLKPFATEQNDFSSDPFIVLLKTIMNTNDRQVMIYLLQVVLEGWGLIHYRGLELSCDDPALRSVLNQIVKDEGLHHATGKELFCNELSANQIQFITDSLQQLLAMVAVGPQRVLRLFEQTLGEFNQNQIETVLDEMQFQTVELKKMQAIGKLIQELPAVYQPLQDKNCFNLLSNSEAATFYFVNR